MSMPSPLVQFEYCDFLYELHLTAKPQYYMLMPSNGAESPTRIDVRRLGPMQWQYAPFHSVSPKAAPRKWVNEMPFISVQLESELRRIVDGDILDS